MLIDGLGLCKKAVKRHHRRDRREECQQPIEDNACRHDEQTVFTDLLVGPPQNVFPSLPWDLPWRGSLPAASRLARALMLQLARLIGAARRAEGARRARRLAPHLRCRISALAPASRKGNRPQSRIAQKRPNGTSCSRSLRWSGCWHAHQLWSGIGVFPGGQRHPLRRLNRRIGLWSCRVGPRT